MPRIRWPFAFLCGLFVFQSPSLEQQKYGKTERGFAQEMLKSVAEDVQKHYYDVKLHGVNWDAKVQEAKRNIDTADSMNTAVSQIAGLLDSLNDSHTVFYPPSRTTSEDYGFKMQMIGDHCFVTHVGTGSDAEEKGLRVGDEVLAINGYPATRKNLPRIHYLYTVLRPQPGLRLTLAESSGHSRQLDVIAAIKQVLYKSLNDRIRGRDDRHLALRARYFEKGDDLLVVRFPEFAFSDAEVDGILGHMRKHKGVVLDLRGNRGGFVKTLDRLLGGIFQDDLKIYDRVGRDSTKSVVATGRHHDAFTGQFAVLIDSKSASASEVFARAVQLEKRGFLVGDRSAGMVMEASFYFHETAVDTPAYFGALITDADLIMADGKSLEHVGVDPDILLLPTAQDLASGKDPVLAKAASMVGGKLSPEEAGAAFPYDEPDTE